MATTTRAVWTLSKRALAKAASALTPLGLNGARLLSDEGGVSAIITALAMTGLLGFSALGVDVGVWYADHNTVQSAADSAAYSAAVDLKAGASTAEVTNVAYAVAAKYGVANGVNGVTVTVHNPPQSGTHKTAGAVEVIISKSEHLFFSSFFLGSVTVGGRAVAASGSTSGNGACIGTLDQNNETSFSTNGNVTVDASKCGIYVDSSGSSALSINGTSGKVLAKTLTDPSGSGGVATSGTPTVTIGGVACCGTVGTGAAIPDPYANVPLPAQGAAPQVSTKSNGVITYYPGTYAQGFNPQTPQTTMVLSDGVYIIPSGTNFTIPAGTNLTGSNVTIVLLGNATMTFGKNTNVTLSAPTSGTYSGLAVLQDRTASTSPLQTSDLSGGTSVNITGALDFPTQLLKFAGNPSTNSTPSTAGCTQLIAYQIALYGASGFGTTCTGTGITQIGVSPTALVE